MKLTKLSLVLIRIAITALFMLLVFTYGIIQSIHTLGHIGDMSGMKLFMLVMGICVWYGVGQVYKDWRLKRSGKYCKPCQRI